VLVWKNSLPSHNVTDLVSQNSYQQGTTYIGLLDQQSISDNFLSYTSFTGKRYVVVKVDAINE